MVVVVVVVIVVSIGVKLGLSYILKSFVQHGSDFLPSFTLYLLNGLTHDEVVPSSLLDDLLHALTIRRRHPVTNHEDEDELDIVTEVSEGSKEPESSIRKPEPQRQLGKSNPYTGN